MIETIRPPASSTAKSSAWLVLLVLTVTAIVVLYLIFAGRVFVPADTPSGAPSQLTLISPADGAKLELAQSNPTDSLDISLKWRAPKLGLERDYPRFRIVIKEERSGFIVAESPYLTFEAGRDVKEDGTYYETNYQDLKFYSKNRQRFTNDLPLLDGENYIWYVSMWNGEFDSQRQDDYGYITFLDQNSPRSNQSRFTFENSALKKDLEVLKPRDRGNIDLSPGKAEINSQTIASWQAEPGYKYRVVIKDSRLDTFHNIVRFGNLGYLGTTEKDGIGSAKATDFSRPENAPAKLTDGRMYELWVLGIREEVLNEVLKRRSDFAADEELIWNALVTDAFAEKSGQVSARYSDRKSHLTITPAKEGKFIDSNDITLNIASADYPFVEEVNIMLYPIAGDTILETPVSTYSTIMTQSHLTYNYKGQHQSANEPNLKAGDYRAQVRVKFKDTGNSIEESVKIYVANSL